MFKVLTGFSRVSDNDLIQQAQHIVNSLKNNPKFASPTPSLSDLQVAIDSFANTLRKVPTSTAIKIKKRAALEVLLSRLGWYVQLYSNNDENIAMSSGFTLAKEVFLK